MKPFLAALFVWLLPAVPPAYAESSWVGVDEAIVEKFAEEAGRKPDDPGFFSKGDLPLFAFLAAGAAGGFICGYYFRQLFPPRKRERPDV